MTLRTRAAVSVIVSVLVAALAGCSAHQAREKERPPVNPRAASLREGFATMDRLVEAARKEGSLVVVGLSHGWVNYGEIIQTFSDKYGIRVHELEPGASSAREMEIAARAKSAGHPAPDVFDLSLEVAVANKRRFAPYRVQTWQDIPDHLKDHGGAWYAAYGGYLSIGYDPRKVAAPSSFADLLKPGYVVALPGDPRRAATAFHGVMAASLAPSAAGAEAEPAAEPAAESAAALDADAEADTGIGPSGADAARGVRFFARLKRAGNLATAGKAPNVVLDWDHVNAQRAAMAEEGAWKVVIPRDAVLASYYVQAIAKNAAHPAAARLWQEFLFSDEGQNLLLRGFARPARMEALEMRNTLDRDAAAKLPPIPAATRPVFLTIPEIDTAKTHLRKVWAKKVG